MAFFGPKARVNPFGKMSIFRLFGLLVIIAQKGVFWFYNIIKDIFLALIAKKNNLNKWPFLDQKQGLTPLEKCQFFDFLDFLLLQPRKAIFVLQYHKRHFPGPYCLKKKSWKNGHFWIKKEGVNPFGKMSIFGLF